MRTLRRIAKILSLWFIDPKTRAFIRFNQKTFRSFHQEKPEGEILVELYTVTQTVVCFAFFVNVLARRHRASIRSFTFRTIPSIFYQLAFRKFVATYRSFNVVGHVNVRLSRAQRREKEVLLAEVLPQLRSKEDLILLNVRGIALGIEIYETYLKEFELPTVDVGEPRFRELMDYSLGALVFWTDYLRGKRVKAVVLSHGLYQYGILVKVARHLNVPCYLPNIRGVTRINDTTRPGTPDFRKYPQVFASLPEARKAPALALSEQKLRRRFSAEVGVDITHQTKSPFDRSKGTGTVLQASNRHKVLIATHCFFDNPHCYGENLFIDFWEWMNFLGRLSEELNYDWYLKTHPDVLPANGPVIEALLRKFPKIRKVPQETSFQQLIEEGLGTVLTVYGSVGHELPLLGATVVNAGFNPHIAYDFNFHPQNLKEYLDLLGRLPELKKAVRTEQVYEFYYVHYYLCVVDDLIVPSYRQLLKDVGSDPYDSPEVYAYFLEHTNLRMHEEAVAKFDWFLESDRTEFYDHQYRQARGL